jgi:hypothetical protein
VRSNRLRSLFFQYRSREDNDGNAAIVPQTQIDVLIRPTNGGLIGFPTLCVRDVGINGVNIVGNRWVPMRSNMVEFEINIGLGGIDQEVLDGCGF